MYSWIGNLQKFGRNRKPKIVIKTIIYILSNWFPRKTFNFRECVLCVMLQKYENEWHNLSMFVYPQNKGLHGECRIMSRNVLKYSHVTSENWIWWIGPTVSFCLVGGGTWHGLAGRPHIYANLCGTLLYWPTVPYLPDTAITLTVSFSNRFLKPSDRSALSCSHRRELSVFGKKT